MAKKYLPIQQGLIKKYTDSTWYLDVHQILTREKVTKFEKDSLQPFLSLFALDKEARLPQHTVLFRGEGSWDHDKYSILENLDDLQVGQVFERKTVTSTSWHPISAMEFGKADPPKRTHGVLLVLHIQHSQDVSAISLEPLSKLEWENEILLEPNLQMEIRKIEKIRLPFYKSNSFESKGYTESIPIQWLVVHLWTRSVRKVIEQKEKENIGKWSKLNLTAKAKEFNYDMEKMIDHVEKNKLINEDCDAGEWVVDNDSDFFEYGMFGSVFDCKWKDQTGFVIKFVALGVLSYNDFYREVILTQICAENHIAPIVYDAWYCQDEKTIYQSGKMKFTTTPPDFFKGPYGVIVMQKINGLTLVETRKSKPDAFPGVALAVIDKINQMHQLNIFHHDMKPSNVLVDDKLNPWIIDFGASRFTSFTGKKIEPFQEMDGVVTDQEMKQHPMWVLLQSKEDEKETKHPVKGKWQKLDLTSKAKELKNNTFKIMQYLRKEGFLKGDCDSGPWTIGERLKVGGSNSKIFEAQRKGEPGYIVKIIDGLDSLDDDFDLEDYAKEAILTRICAEHGIAPMIYDVWYCPDQDESFLQLKFINDDTKEKITSPCFVMVMYKMDGMLLEDFLIKTCMDTSKWIPVIENLETKIKKMHDLGIAHLDLHQNNILIDKSSIPWIIDFGSANFTTSKKDFSKDDEQPIDLRRMISEDQAKRCKI